MTSNCVIAGANAVVLSEFVLVTVILMCLLDTTCPIKSGSFTLLLCVCVRACLCACTCIHKRFTNQIKASTADYWLLWQCVSSFFIPSLIAVRRQ